MMLEAFDRIALLSNGHPVHIAPARAGDEVRVREFYERLGDESTYYRFFGMRRAIPDLEFADLVRPACRQHATMLASIGDELVGIGEYHAGADADEAEVAFAVSDEHHDEGVGTLLLEDLAVIAEHFGYLRLVAQTLPTNGPMQVVFRTAGLDEHAEFDDGVIEFRMDLADLDGLAAAAAERQRLAISATDGAADWICAPGHEVSPGASDTSGGLQPLR